MTHFADDLENRKRLQQVLADLNYYHGAIDGILGIKSADAIRTYRAAIGIGATATIDDALLNALNLRNPSRKENPMDTVLANVKSAWASKVNWTLGLTFLFNALAFFGVAVPTDVREAAMMLITSLGIVVAWVIKTWFTTSITAASAKKL